MFLKFINFPIFLLSLAVGTLFVYLSAPSQRVVYVYPTPDNVGKVEYVDKVKNCYHFNAVEMDCPSKQDDIKEIPIQG